MANLSLRQTKLLSLFNNEETLTSLSISRSLKVSEKTIRNEIKEINLVYPNLIISLKSKGYQIKNHKLLKELIKEEIDNNDSSNYLKIIYEVIHHKEYDYHKLADELYISESTLDKYINNINQIIERRNPKVIIKRKNNYLYIDEDEIIRRQIYLYLMNHELDRHNFDLNKYQKMFKIIDINYIKEYFIDFIKRNNIKLRDFEFISFILHISVMIERINDGYEISNINNFIPSGQAISLANDFYNGIKDKINIKLSDNEKHYLACLFSGRLLSNDESIIKEYRKFIEEITDDIYLEYGYDLRNDKIFKENLLVHFLALDNRIQTNNYLNNPLIKEIKHNFPLMYDISVNIALKIKQKEDTIILEDEIGYITLHLLNAVERNKMISKSVLIINSMGGSTGPLLRQKIINASNLNLKITIIESIFDIQNTDLSNIDLIVSYFSINDKLDIPVYICNIVPSEKDIENIINILKRSVKKEAFDIHKFFKKELYFSKLDLNNKEEVIDYLCLKLSEQGYCSDDYKEFVKQREAIAPTAYGNLFAIPHPVKKCAYKNGVAVCTLKNPIIWNNKKVQLIFLYSLAEEVNFDFDAIYEIIVDLLNDITSVKRIIKEDNFDSFIKQISKNQS